MELTRSLASILFSVIVFRLCFSDLPSHRQVAPCDNGKGCFIVSLFSHATRVPEKVLQA